MAAEDDLSVFEGLSGEQIRAIAGAFDGLGAAIRDNTGATPDDAGVLSAVHVLCGLCSGAGGEDLRRAVRDSGLSGEKVGAFGGRQGAGPRGWAEHAATL